MLRHDDHLGLLTPAQTDPSSGYRHYAPHQLARLNRVTELQQPVQRP